MSSSCLSEHCGLQRTSHASPAQLEILAEVIRTVVRKHRLTPDDADDFSQSVHLKLIRRNYDIFERFSGRSSLRTFLTVAIVRQLLDWRDSRFGKWRPSVRARRLGQTAVELERLLSRDGLSESEAVASLATRSGTSVVALESLLQRLPVRPRRPGFRSDVEGGAIVAVAFEDPIERAERQRRNRQARLLLRDAVADLSMADRLILQSRFSSGLTVRSASVALSDDPKRLYRRLHRILSQLRCRMASQGFGANTIWE